MKQRVQRMEWVRAGELLPHPQNWRLHGDRQREALARAQEVVGFTGAVIAYRDDDGRLVIVDGHLRAASAPADEELPVLITDLTAAEAKVALGSHDAIGAMATTDATLLDELLMDDEFTTLLADAEADALLGDIEWATALPTVRENAKRAAAENWPPLPTGTYRAVIVDPPWRTEFRAGTTDVHARPRPLPYQTMTQTDLLAFELPTCADDSILFLRALNGRLLDALALLDAWSFRYRALLTWAKPWRGWQPNGCPRLNADPILMAVRGNPQLRHHKGFTALFEGARGEHSTLPAEFYAMVRRATAGPRCVLFPRDEKPAGFSIWDP